MNINTGEMVEINEEMSKLIKEKAQEDMLPKDMFPKSGPTKRSDIVELQVGEMIDVKGCPCEIVHINPGKGRFSLRPRSKMQIPSSNPKKLVKTK